MQKLRGQVSEDMILHDFTFELLFSAGFGSTWRCSKIQQNDGPAFVGWPDLSCQMDVNSEVGHERQSDEPGNVVIIAMFGCVNNDVHSYYTKQLHKHYQHGSHC